MNNDNIEEIWKSVSIEEYKTYKIKVDVKMIKIILAPILNRANTSKRFSIYLSKNL